METTLNEAEIKFFYDILYNIEHEKPIGYNDRKVEKRIGEEVKMDNKHSEDENLTTPQLNVFQYSPRYWNKCSGLLGHPRNAFAHGNIDSVEDNKFLIKDFSDKSKRSKCNMLALIEKTKFYNLIEAMKDTRNVEKAKKKESKKRESRKNCSNKLKL